MGLKYGSLRALKPRLDLNMLPRVPRISSWASASNKARFVIYADKDGKRYKNPHFTTFDLDRGTIQADTPPINSVNANAWSNQIDSTGQGVYSLVYRSPLDSTFFTFPKKSKPTYTSITRELLVSTKRKLGLAVPIMVMEQSDGVHLNQILLSIGRPMSIWLWS